MIRAQPSQVREQDGMRKGVSKIVQAAANWGVNSLGSNRLQRFGNGDAVVSTFLFVLVFTFDTMNDIKHP